jgi:Fe-S-cluster containining protein
MCEQCVGLCCRYYAFAIETPTKKRDFDDIRWYMLHGDNIIFVEEGEWFIQINHKCNALMDDNLCAIYENRPAICREYSIKECDILANEYGYDHLFTEPEQIEQFGKQYLAKQRKQRAAARKKTGSKTKAQSKKASKAATPKRTKAKPGMAKVSRIPVRLLKTA